jgi:hypothetical protein
MSEEISKQQTAPSPHALLAEAERVLGVYPESENLAALRESLRYHKGLLDRLAAALREREAWKADAERWRAVRKASCVDGYPLNPRLLSNHVQVAAPISTPDEYADALIQREQSDARNFDTPLMEGDCV